MATAADRMTRAYAALDFLKAHALDPTPAYFALALLYVSAPESALAREIDALTDDGMRLSDADAAAMARRVAADGDALSMGLEKRKMVREAGELEVLTNEAQTITGALGYDVAGMATRATAGQLATDEVATRLSSAERELVTLRHELSLLAERIAAPAVPEAPKEEGGAPGSRDTLDRLAASGQSFLTIIFSLDSLDDVIRTYGFSVGENVVAALAATIEANFPEDQLLRLTGGELAIAGTISPNTARRNAEDALLQFSRRRLKLRGSGAEIGELTASAGLVIGQSEPADHILARARLKLLSAVASGGNKLES